MLKPVDLYSVNGSKEQLNVSDEEAVCLKSIKEWLNDNPHVNGRKDDPSLLYFIRSCKHDLERTKERITSFYLMKAYRTEWFTDRNPFSPKLQELLELGVFLPLHVKDDLNRRIFVVRAAVHNPRTHHMNDVFKISMMILDLALEMYPDISICGIVAIFDLSGVTWQHALQLNPPLIKRGADSWQIYPCQPKLLEFVNAPVHVNIVLKFFRVCLSAKLRSRLFVRRELPTVNAALPKELGGNGESYVELTKFWKEKVEQNVDFFKYDEQFKTIIEDSS